VVADLCAVDIDADALRERWERRNYEIVAPMIVTRRRRGESLMRPAVNLTLRYCPLK